MNQCVKIKRNFNLLTKSKNFEQAKYLKIH